jgi:hypothetical protein
MEEECAEEEISSSPVANLTPLFIRCFNATGFSSECGQFQS